jgi:TPR repeat protein
MAPTKDAQRLRRAAERKGKAEDQYQLACHFYHGREGLKQDLVAAAKWWSKAAAQEHAGAQCDLGMCYSKGEGVEQSYALAASWVSKAADQGHAKGQGCFGFLYHEGKSVEQDDVLAVEWWEKGAVGDDADSQYNLGLGYTEARLGLPKNAHCAKIYMMAAAKGGHPDAIEALKVLRACAACGAPDASRACQGCRSATGLSTARYCTPACQAAHWKAHAPDCGPCQCHRCK